jgi:hypothetical protein
MNKPTLTNSVPISLTRPESKVADLFDATENEMARLFPTRNAKRIMLVQTPDTNDTQFDYGTGKRGRYTN